jgi:uncharacterized membrane protein YkgB
MKWDRFYSDIKERMVIESQYLSLLYKNKNEVELLIEDKEELEPFNKENFLLLLKRQ